MAQFKLFTQVPKQFQDAIAEVKLRRDSAAQDPQAYTELVGTLCGLLDQIPSDQEPAFRVMVLGMLGSVHGNAPGKGWAQNLAKSIACYEEALRCCDASAGPALRGWLQQGLGASYARSQSGVVADNLGSAVACYEETLRLCGEVDQPDEHARALNGLGCAVMMQPRGDRAENVSRAIKCFERALRMLTREADPHGYSMVQINLGQAYRRLPTGDREENVHRAIECLEAARAACGPQVDPSQYARNMHSLGNAFGDLGTGPRAENLARAIAYYEEALQYWTEERAPVDYALAKYTLGETLRNLPGERSANIARAIDCYEDALRFLSPSDTPSDYALTQNALGVACWARPDGDREANMRRAIRCFEKALLVWTKTNDPFNHAGVMTNLGLVHRSLPDADARALVRSVECYEEALSFFTAESAPFEYARTNHNLAEVHIELVEYADRHRTQAVACYHEALRFWTLDSAPDHRRMSASRLARLHFEVQDWGAALDACRIALDADEWLYRAGLSTSGKASALDAGASLYQMAAHAAAKVADATSALLLLERGKTRLLAEALRLRTARPAGVSDQAWTAFETAAAAVRAMAHSAHSGGVHTEIVGVAREAAGALDAAVEAVREHAPSFLTQLDRSALASLLEGDNVAVIAFAVTDQGSVGLVVGPDGAVISVDVPGFNAADLRALIMTHDPDRGWLVDHRRYRDTPTLETAAAWQATMSRVLGAVGERLLWPILRHLPASIERVVLLPSGALFLLPLHAAPFSPGAPERVCDRFEVSYAPSIEVLLECRSRAARSADQRLYAVVNPEADPRLAFAAIEGESIKRLFTAHEVVFGANATKTVVTAGLRQRSHVHFACHAAYDWEDPAESGLALFDGRLRRMDLDDGAVDLKGARLITLSACETGIIDVIKNSPGEYVGLPAALLSAGAPCVVSSLWVVSDISTAMLMERFYGNHVGCGKTPSAALGEAQAWLRQRTHEVVAEHASRWAAGVSPAEQAKLRRIELEHRRASRRSPNERPFAHPHYWAPFQVIGA